MPKTYDPKEVETRWYTHWEASGYFSPDLGAEAPPFAIMIPPPNVTGTLHMGHAFQDTLMDALTRYHRMRGHRTLWQPGSDHAGIATQMVVERQLEQEGQTRHDLGRQAFVERVWEWKETSGNVITQQLRRMGASADWSRERFTMDEGLSRAVNEVFVRLYREGLIYRGQRLVNWDPVLHTAISDLEVESEEEPGHLWHFRYPLADGSGHVTVATTRPETMLGDQAVAVHPEDERYTHLIGKTIRLPLAEREIPVIADEYVDPEFGSGCVKITPAHDFNDYEMGRRHDLPMLNILTDDARINHNAPPAYRGLDRYEARERVVADLEGQGLMEAVEDHNLMVPRGDRSGTVIEPFLTDQWFVKVGPLAKPAIEAVETGDIRFVPENWAKTYFEWMHNLEDWCISRQIWWGHRVPVWYCADCDENHLKLAAHDLELDGVKVGPASPAWLKYHDFDLKEVLDQVEHVSVGTEATPLVPEDGQDRPEDCPHCGGRHLIQDPDVLDTWFSSALWPFSTLGWPEDTKELATFYPTSVLVTGFDIIFFWVARMIMMGLKFMDDVPFEEVYVHGLVRDSEGNKMSKSKGNVLDPLDLIDGIDLEALVEKRTSAMMQPAKAKAIEKMTRKEFPDGIPAFGADALRFTFASLATMGRDIKFDLGRIEGYRNFCTKLWNAARFNLMNVTEPPAADTAPGWADRWIVSRLQRTEAEVAEAMAAYRFNDAAHAAYDFIWHSYCDWYLELVKPALNGDDREAAESARRTMIRVLEASLRLLHPFMPFITEEIWQKVAPLAGREGETIMRQPYPEADEGRMDSDAEAEFEWLEAFVGAVRSIRGEMNINPNQAIPLLLRSGGERDRQRVEEHRIFIDALTRPESLDWVPEGEEPPQSATGLAGDLQVLVPLEGLIDVEAEIQRLDKELEKVDADLERSRKKLDNPSFRDKAPEDVVDKEREKLAEFESRQQQLRDQRERLAALQG
ncbi:valyl-tRNA synthetase [Thiohalorhabdus denitrificans]|uniref:valine--tRNA ligase n=1 Tax=Thiohalorhabdus denitrificans TaxID=381306 RepID=UPI0006D5807E|nr:valine--tRNA ligase [Thiohalorhabdus denitrificans]KPV40512.1 valyl-tRNA synthetase [Thiohalorhabdus denitrificans]